MWPMARNLEIKARVKDRRKLEAVVKKVAGKANERVEQEDTYFRVPNGRLKLRVTGCKGGQLIYYERSNQAGAPRSSDYLIVPIGDTEELKRVLGEALGIAGTVSKQRLIHLLGRTRIHLDKVKGLGDFVELEYVFDEVNTLHPVPTAEDERAALATVAELMGLLGITLDNLIGNSYLDLQAAR